MTCKSNKTKLLTKKTAYLSNQIRIACAPKQIDLKLNIEFTVFMPSVICHLVNESIKNEFTVNLNNQTYLLCLVSDCCTQ